MIGFRGSLRTRDLRQPVTVGQAVFRANVGVVLAIVLAWVIVLAMNGCASMNQECSYYPDGMLKAYRLRSTVVGTGETEVVATDCAVATYSTQDTGLSDNGREAMGVVAEGAARGAVGALVPGSSILTKKASPP